MTRPWRETSRAPITAKAKTKRVDGEDLEKSAFAYQGSDDLDDWKLPIKFSTHSKTESHIRNAIARWSTTDMPNTDEKANARTRIRAAAAEYDIDVGEGSLAHAHARMTRGFRAELQLSGALELLVYEDIGEDPWSGYGVTAKAVKEQIDSAGEYGSINLRINSPGGDAFEGVAIMNLLRSTGKPVNVFVDGIAASAASIVAMAGTTITMGRAAMMMVHNPWTICMGAANDMRQCAQTLDAIGASIGEAYQAKTGKTAAEIKAIMDAETWMGAQECVDQGFATAIAADDDEEDEALALARSFRTLDRLTNVPASLRVTSQDDDVSGALCDCSRAGCTDDGNCDGAAMDSNLSQYEARLTLLRLAA